MKKLFKKNLSFSLMFIFILGIMNFGTLTVFADTNSDFTIDAGGVLTKYNGTGGQVTIPDSVNSIGADAFYGCASLTSVIIPKNVKSIGYGAFFNCTSLTNINVETDNGNYLSKDGVLFNKDKTQLILYPIGRKDKYYIVPNTVTTIGDYAFDSCKNLNSITIPSSVKRIGNSAFYSCTGLSSLSVPDSVKDIDLYAFSFCSNLNSISLPDSITSISGSAFWNCSSLTSIDIPNSVTSISGIAFWNCTNLTSVTIPKSVTSIGSDTFYNCPNLTIYSEADSYAKEYAKANNRSFRLIGCSNDKNSIERLYSNAYFMVTAAMNDKTEQSISDARTAIEALYGTDAAWAMGEFSKQLDQIR